MMQGWVLLMALGTAIVAGAGNTDAGTPQTIASGLLFPEGPALSRDGKTLYVVNVQSPLVSRIDLKSGTLARDWVTLPDGGRGNGATLGPDGALYVADVGAKRIVRIDTKTRAVTTVTARNEKGEPLRGPNDLVFDRAGGLYFTDPDGSWDTPVGAVYHVAPPDPPHSTRVVTRIADGLRFPNGLALSRDEKTLYVAETPLGRVDAFDLTPLGAAPSGAPRVFAHVGGAEGPDGMRLGRDGFLYVAVFGDGVIAKVSPQGEVVRRYPVSVGKHVTNLCFAPDGHSLYVTETDSNLVIKLPL